MNDINVLNIGSGKNWREDVQLSFSPSLYKDRDVTVYCLDTMYDVNGIIPMTGDTYKTIFMKKDVFEFLEKWYENKFDRILSYRFFEHVSYKDLPYLIYLIYTVSKPKAIMDIIVPDFKEIFKRFEIFDNNDLTINKKLYEKYMIQFHTEIFNETNDPHQSLWTDNIADHFLTLENYWKIVDIAHNVELDRRNWYMQIICERI